MQLRYLAFLLSLALWTLPAAAQKANQPVPVVAMTVQKIAFRDRVEALGTLRANESVAITSVVADTVNVIRFEDGDRVEKGQVLVEMTTAEEKAIADEARSTLDEARSQFERSKSLTDRRLTPETVLDQRRRDFETARARVAAIDARLADRILKAPFAGRIGLRTVSTGALVSPGDVIARIEDDSVMKLDFSVPTTFLSALKVGLDIEARARGFDDQMFTGTVATIDNRVDEATRTIRVRALIPNPDRKLVPGLLMSIDLYKNPRMSLSVREEALVPIGPDTYVFVITPGKNVVERRRIETGARRPGIVEVIAGLEEGELVVTDGTVKLRPGAAVKVTATDEIKFDPDAKSSAAPQKPAGRS
ncbi:MAG: efflux RND transporter periplasmic adaptor subunit [Hyphomicrobiaceae bacterium]|nr:efflux RND transporter periplasmic adaptor subunit [Hyphomicrobiaceae bacterium]